MRRSLLLLVLPPLAFLAGCATVPTDLAALAAFKANNDPLEPLNRTIFGFNQGADRFLIKPMAKAYVHVLPQAARDTIRNFLKNLHEPVVFANDLLQGDLKRAGKTAERFGLNSTAGFFGAIDVAAQDGCFRQTGDFGQTLHAWGFPEGPYLVLPLLGPSNPRDTVGFGVDIYIDPFRYIMRKNHYPSAVSVGEFILAGIDERSRNIDSLDEIQRESIDYYASLRSLFRQNRQAELNDGKSQAPVSSPAEDIYSDPGAASPPAPPKP